MLALFLLAIIKPVSAQTPEKFIKTISKDAQEICRDNDLYASVLIAQAAIESNFGRSGLSVSPINNLFGIKGSYNGNSVLVPTKEDDGSGNLYEIKAAFKKYPNTRSSIEDYVKLLSEYGNGYYYGVRKSYTNGSYKQATRFLTGRYATDTTYHFKLDYIISAYNLTQYDVDPYEPIEPVEIESITPSLVENNSIQCCEEVSSYDNILNLSFDKNDIENIFSNNEIEPDEIINEDLSDLWEVSL